MRCYLSVRTDLSAIYLDKSLNWDKENKGFSFVDGVSVICKRVAKVNTTILCSLHTRTIRQPGSDKCFCPGKSDNVFVAKKFLFLSSTNGDRGGYCGRDTRTFYPRRYSCGHLATNRIS